MKPFNKRISSIDSPKMKSKNTVSQMLEIPTETNSSDRPSPHSFDEIVPWLCLQYQMSANIEITRFCQDNYVNKNQGRRHSNKSAKSAKIKGNESPIQTEKQQKDSDVSLKDKDKDCISIKTYYNFDGQLQEMSIMDCPFPIDRIFIQVVILIMPYHPTLTKLTINRGLSAPLLHDIGKLLNNSNLTDICLDDTCVPQNNYADLLKITSHLRSLSLNRCHLLDDACKEIVAFIDINKPGSSTLRTLELSSNGITDEGALAIGNVLRRNRRLFHLNLSGNCITDKGAQSILNALMEFPMEWDEIMQMKRNKMEYNRKKIALYGQYLKDTVIENHRSDIHVKGSKNVNTTTGGSKVKSPMSKKTNNKKSQKDENIFINKDNTDKSLMAKYSHPDLEQKVTAIITDISEPFDKNHRILKDEYFYCVGNMFLCSLNLAYNNLEYSSIQKIESVLKYQCVTKKVPGATGLLRITFEGNRIPKFCEEYIHIDMMLQNVINNIVPKIAGTLKKRSALIRKSTGIIPSRA